MTICNVNQAQRSAVLSIPRKSEEYSVLQSICRYTVDENVTNSIAGTWNSFRKVLLDVSNLVQLIKNLIQALLSIYLFIRIVSGRSTVQSNAHWMSIWWNQYELLEYFQ